MDDIDIQILNALQENARIPIAELARRTGLSEKGARQRMRKLEEDGAIAGYRAVINPARIGFPLRAYLTVRSAPDAYNRLIARARDTAGIREVHLASGPCSFVMRAVARDEADLARLVDAFREFGEVQCAQILSTPVEKHTA